MEVVQIVGDETVDYLYGQFFEDMEISPIYSKDIRDVGGVDLVCLVGGEDVDPRFYGEPKDKRTMFTEDSSAEDGLILDGLIPYAVNQRVPIIGICKGAQQLCVYSGGGLIQHIDGHHGLHDIELMDGTKLSTRGGHHQSVRLGGVAKYKVLATSVPDHLPDVVHYPLIKGLGMQYHPEWHTKDDPGWRYAQYLVEELLRGTIK